MLTFSLLRIFQRVTLKLKAYHCVMSAKNAISEKFHLPRRHQGSSLPSLWYECFTNDNWNCDWTLISCCFEGMSTASWRSNTNHWTWVKGFQIMRCLNTSPMHWKMQQVDQTAWLINIPAHWWVGIRIWFWWLTDGLIEINFPTQGHPRLVQILSKLYTKLVGHAIDPLNGILITSSPMTEIIQSYVDNGDEVIIIEPFSDHYEPMMKLAGGILRYIPLRLVRVWSEMKIFCGK